MNQTILQIDQELRELTNAHNQVKSYYYGDFLSILKKSIEYTCVMANISNASRVSDQLVRLNVDLFVCDKTLKGDENKLYVENETLQILIDLCNVIAYAPKWQEFGVVTVNPSFRKYYDRTADVVTGWSTTFSVDIISPIGYCDLPIFGYNYES